jgi:hypothetical protein
MNKDDPDANGIEESNIDQEALHLLLRLHRATSELDQENPTTEFLKIGQGLNQRLGTLA